MGKEKILVVEDEAAIRELIKLNLNANGFSEVYTSNDGENAVTEALKRLPDLILLDLMLPNLDGLGVCRILKSNPETARIPIIMLTAKTEESDIVLGLELGAADYITKPFSNKVLIARVRAQLRKTVLEVSGEKIKCGALQIDVTEHSAKLDGMPIELTFSEFELLVLLAKHPNRVFTRNQIVGAIKGDDYPVTERAIDVQVLNLRRKLGDYGKTIETVRGVGYKLNPEY